MARQAHDGAPLDVERHVTKDVPGGGRCDMGSPSGSADVHAGNADQGSERFAGAGSAVHLDAWAEVPPDAANAERQCLRRHGDAAEGRPVPARGSRGGLPSAGCCSRYEQRVHKMNCDDSGQFPRFCQLPDHTLRTVHGLTKVHGSSMVSSIRDGDSRIRKDLSHEHDRIPRFAER